jgi:hypothetical protein
MSHVLSEKIAGLASRVKNLADNHTGNDSRELLQEQARLVDLASAAIIKDLNSEHEAYRAALAGLKEAINFIGEADKEIGGVAKAIKLVKGAADLVDTAIKTATKATGG